MKKPDTKIGKYRREIDIATGFRVKRLPPADLSKGGKR